MNTQNDKLISTRRLTRSSENASGIEIEKEKRERKRNRKREEREIELQLGIGQQSDGSCETEEGRRDKG